MPSRIIVVLARSRSFSNLSFLKRFAWIFGRFLNDSRCFIAYSRASYRTLCMNASAAIDKERVADSK